MILADNAMKVQLVDGIRLESISGIAITRWNIVFCCGSDRC